METTKTFEIRVPFFSGFYNSLWDNNFYEDDEIDYSTMEFDFKSYGLDVSKAFTSEIETLLQKTFKGVVSLDFKELVSPREYNFTIDKIYANLNVNYDMFWEHFLTLIEKHKDNVKLQISEVWSSRSGFMSFLSTDLDTWLSDIENEGELGWLMGILFELETEDSGHDIEERIFETLSSNGYIENAYYK